MALTAGQIVHNRYRIEALLGQGGMGAVYRATDLVFSTQVAVKENLETSPQAQQQFAHEAGTLHRLRHPNLPIVHDYFFLPGQGQYLVMDYVAGQDLDQVLARGPVPEPQALAWIGQVLDALEYLHSQTPPIIHRDVKPANVKIDPQGRVFLVDFGLVKAAGPSQLTATGARAATPGFAPLEQYGVARTDARTDLYAVGATLYAALTGQAPPGAPDMASGAAALVAPRRINPRISPRVEAAVLRAMQPRQADRPQSAAELRAMLLPVVVPTVPVVRPPSRARWLWAAAGVLALALLVVGAVRLFGGGPAQPTPLPTRAPVSPAPTRVPVVTPVPTEALPTPGPTAPREGVRPTDGMGMLPVPAGEFTMGSSDSEIEAAVAQCVANGYSESDCRTWVQAESPQHRVYLGDFWIDRTEVSNGQYRKCVDAGRCPQAGYSGDSDYNAAGQPVVGVSWDNAVAYCAWAGARLPTEAEWEKAARGTDGRIYPWGDESPDCSRLNYWGKDGGCVGRPSEVGTYASGASPYGVLDMAGNVWEWVSNWYGAGYYAGSPAENPTGPGSGEYRVIRGGSWLAESIGVRAAARYGADPTHRVNYLGFRCAASVSPQGR